MLDNMQILNITFLDREVPFYICGLIANNK